MKINVIYPTVEKKRKLHKFVSACKWTMIFSAYACPIINYLVGGKAWSLIVLMGLYMLWTLVVSPALVEYNRISQTVRFIVCSCAMMVLVDVFIDSGWAINVVPIVCFSGLIVSALLFFTDIERQKQNMMPMLMFIMASLVGAIVSLIVFKDNAQWPFTVMWILAVTLILACLIILRKDFGRELKRRFHIK